MILLLFIFVVSHAQSMHEIKKYHYPKLLKKWQERSDYQEMEQMECAWCTMNDNEVDETIRKAMKTYYNIDIGGSLIGGINIGKQLEYKIVRVNVSSTNERMWFLISRPLKKIVSTYKETFDRESDLYLSSAGSQQVYERRQVHERDAQNHFLYELLFKKFKKREKAVSFWCSNIPTVHQVEPRDVISCQSWWGLGSYLNEDIDSATANCIAVSATEMCYGSEMTVLATMLMGDNEEYWMAYCFPTVWLEKEEEKRGCYDNLNYLYNIGTLLLRRSFGGDICSKCPNVIGILISRETGQVLSMIEL